METLGVKNAQLHLFSRKLQWEISSHASSHPLCMHFQHLEKTRRYITPSIHPGNHRPHTSAAIAPEMSQLFTPQGDSFVTIDSAYIHSRVLPVELEAAGCCSAVTTSGAGSSSRSIGSANGPWGRAVRKRNFIRMSISTLRRRSMASRRTTLNSLCNDVSYAWVNQV